MEGNRVAASEVEAYAFRRLVQHLSDRSESVANIDLMATGGFCRNCLSKWYPAGAKKLIEAGLGGEQAFEYADALQRVYGREYADWKKAFQKKATPEQLARLQASKDIHAKHDDEAAQAVKDPCCVDAEDMTCALATTSPSDMQLEWVRIRARRLRMWTAATD